MHTRNVYGDRNNALSFVRMSNQIFSLRLKERSFNSRALDYQLLDSYAHTLVREATCGEAVDAIIGLPDSQSFIRYLVLY